MDPVSISLMFECVLYTEITEPDIWMSTDFHSQSKSSNWCPLRFLSAVWGNSHLPELSNYHFPEFFFSDLCTFLQSQNSASRVWPDCAFTENGRQNLRKKANHFCLVDGTLHYIHQKSKKNLR